jgi:hypothetical protein
MAESKLVKLKVGSINEYLDEKIADNIDDNTLYFCEDSKQMFKGNTLYSSGYLDDFIEVNVTDWKDVQKIVKAGVANQFFSAGDVFKTTYTYKTIDYNIDWVILGFDHDKVDYDNKYEHTMTIAMKNCTCDRIYFSHRIAFAVVNNHTLRDGTVVDMSENITYEGEMSTLDEATILSAEDHTHIWKYTGASTTISDGSDITSGDLICRSKVYDTKVTKITHYSLLGAKGEYNIESYVIGENISVDTGIDIMYNMSQYAYPVYDVVSVGICSVNVPLFTGCQLVSTSTTLYNVSVYPNQTSNTIFTQIRSDDTNYSEGIAYVDTLPEYSNEYYRKWCILKSTDKWYYYNYSTKNWELRFVHKGIPEGSPVASVGTTDYTLSDARIILNSESESAISVDNWVPNNAFNIFDHMPSVNCNGLIYQLKYANDNDTLNMLDVLIQPTKYIFDGSHDQYSAYVSYLDKYLACSDVVDENLYGIGNNWWIFESENYMINSIDDIQTIVNKIQDGTLFDDEEDYQNKSIDDINKGITFFSTAPITLPNGDVVNTNIEYDEDVFVGLVIYLPDDNKDISECFYNLELVNDWSMNQSCKLTALKSFNDTFFLLGAAEVNGMFSSDEGKPYEYYTNEMETPTDNNETIRIKRKVNSTSTSIYGDGYLLRSIGNDRDYVRYVYGSGSVGYSNFPADCSYYLGPACTIG